MVFTGEFGFQSATIPGTSASTEVEFTVLVYPKSKSTPRAAKFEDYLLGKTAPGTVGQLRLDVLCDDDVAVSAGRVKFGEHKFLGSFEYNYPTANANVGSAKPFSLDMTASTFQGAGVASHQIFRIRANLAGLSPLRSGFAPELLYSAFPPEPQEGVIQKAVGEHRHYGFALQAFLPTANHPGVELNFGDAQGAQALKPVAPYGDGVAIPGSENWPSQMRDRMKGLLTDSPVAGYLLFQPRPVEYETKPFEL